MDASAWNERYRSANKVWTGEPNTALLEVAPTPAADGALALDLGCGEGADALWLAAQGWRVFGVDWAGVALDRARGAAHGAGADAQFIEGDITDAHALAGLSPTGRFDLVLVAYLHPEPADRATFYGHLTGLLAPGGQLLVIAHDPEHGQLGLPGPDPRRLLSAEDILAALDPAAELEVLARSTKHRTRDGAVTAVDSVVLMRRPADD
jgi:SAM-dependent methyltransferase